MHKIKIYSGGKCKSILCRSFFGFSVQREFISEFFGLFHGEIIHRAQQHLIGIDLDSHAETAVFRLRDARYVHAVKIFADAAVKGVLAEIPVQVSRDEEDGGVGCENAADISPKRSPSVLYHRFARVSRAGKLISLTQKK